MGTAAVGPAGSGVESGSVGEGVGPGAGASVHAQVEHVLTSYDTSFVWSYASVKEGLRDLYEKAKRDQWNGTSQVAWDTEVDPESEILPDTVNWAKDYAPFRKLDAREVRRFRHANISWLVSQFLHGEQGALLIASQLVGAVPWMDAKAYAATQTMDEARHVEVYSRYLREKLEWEWPISDSLRELFRTLLTDARWDFKYLGMQVLAEGTAMAVFANTQQLTSEPLLRDLVRYVLADESRHVAFGVLSLRDYYAEMAPSEIRDREDLIIEASNLLAGRLVPEDVARHLGWNVDEVRELTNASIVWQTYRKLMFSRVIPNLAKLGLLTPRVREAFTTLGVLQYENAGPEA